MLDKVTIEYLEQQRDKKYTFEDCDKLELVQTLMKNIGDKDSHLRDGLIYPNLAHLLYDKHFTEEELTSITNEFISDEYLTFDMDNKAEYSVLKRSFTLLQLVIIVYVHRRDGIIESSVIQEVYDRFKHYFINEKVLDGYRPEVGWMHSIAHSADLFEQLVQVEDFKETQLEEMFQLITSKLKDSNHFYRYDEDERMVKAIVKGLNRKILHEEFLIQWVEEFSTYEKITEYPQAYNLTNNIKCFLRSLYFALLDNKDYSFMVEKIKTVLKENVKLH